MMMEEEKNDSKKEADEEVERDDAMLKEDSFHVSLPGTVAWLTER